MNDWDSFSLGLEKLLYEGHTGIKDWMMRQVWGQDGSSIPRPQFYPEARDSWKEMLERDMWRKYYSQPGSRMGVQGAMPRQPGIGGLTHPTVYGIRG